MLAVPPAYTSQRCACCGHTAKENRLSQSKLGSRYLDIQRTPMSMALVTFLAAGTPFFPVERWCSQAAR
ncbi:zinc ribbon domain-containing protein [Shigella flexneri]